MPKSLSILLGLLLLGAAPASAAEGQAQAAKDCPQCPELVVVPAGKFKMGSDAKGAMANEKPTREVTLKSVAIGKYDVTFAEWDACVADGGCRQYRAASVFYIFTYLFCVFGFNGFKRFHGFLNTFNF